MQRRPHQTLIALLALAVHACTPAAGSDVDADLPSDHDAGARDGGAWDGGAAADGDGGAEGGPDASSPASCDGISCTGHGSCEVAEGVARCVCGAGYSAVGPRCLAVETPAWPLEIAGWNRHRIYPGIPYVSRVAVRGGTYPYRFTLGEGPADLRLEANGTIVWDDPRPGTHRVSIEVTDSVGGRLALTLDLNVSVEGARFVSMSGDDSGPGTRDAPWRTVDHATLTATGDTTIYISPGTYDVAEAFYASAPEAYVGIGAERPILDFRGGARAISRPANARMLFQSLEVRNGGAKLFWLQGRTSHLVFFRCDLHGVRSTGADNPAFIFSEDGGARRTVPGSGTPLKYDDLVLQENLLHDHRSAMGHGGGVVFYDVERALVEDNEVFDLDGDCLQDKDDGYLNVFRGNTLHGCTTGVGLLNQYSQNDTEVLYNLIYDTTLGVRIGHQPGYIRRVYVHHNTIVDAPIYFRWSIGEEGSDDIHVYANLMVADVAFTTVDPPEHMALISGRVHVDGNVSFSASGTVYDSRYGSDTWDFAAWRALGFDPDGEFIDPGLGAEHRLPATSVLRGVAGRE